MLSRPLPLIIACIIALLPIRLTICGDPLIWASVEAQAEFKTKPDGGPGGECSLPSTFQMRADGSWLPSSEFDLTGNFDEDCGIFLHLSIPEDEPKGGEVVRSETKKLLEKKKDLQNKEDNLLKEKKEHDDKMKALKNEKEQLDSSNVKIEDARGKKNALNEKKDDLTRRRNSLADKLKDLGISDVNSTIEKLKENEKKIVLNMAEKKAREIFLNEILNGVCSRIPTSLYLSVVDDVSISSNTKIYVCHGKGVDHGQVIKGMWESEVARVDEMKKGLKKSADAVESKVSELESERKNHAANMKKLEDEKAAVVKKIGELTALHSRLETQRARKNDVDAKRMDVEAKKNLIKFSDGKVLEEEESRLSWELLRVEAEIELLKDLLALDASNGCDPLEDADYLIIKNDVKYHAQDILVCEPKSTVNGIDVRGQFV